MSEVDLARAVRAGKTVRLIAPILNPGLMRRLEELLGLLGSHYQRPDLEECLHSCVVELATNASRANMKHVYFRQRGVDSDDPVEYARGLREFKINRENPGWHRSLQRGAREMGLYLEVIFRHSQHGLCVEVVNNLPLLPQDERRIREKMATAMRTSDIYQYYNEHGDDTEGQGLGFAMNVLLLRSENIDPSYLRIGSRADCTIARLEIPFSREYIPVRDQRRPARSDLAALPA